MIYLRGGAQQGGRAIVNLIGCEPNEKVEAFVSVKEFDDEHYIVMATEKGLLKKLYCLRMENPEKAAYMRLK